MTTYQQIQKHRACTLNLIHRRLQALPLTYIQNMRFHSTVKKHPLETLVMGRELTTPDYHQRIKKWVAQAIASSPHVNN
jgi:hypothetical protein